MFYLVDKLILPSFFIYWIFRWLHKLARNEFFFFFHTLQLKVETLGIRNSQGHFFIDETQTRLCVPALLASSWWQGYKWLGTGPHPGNRDPTSPRVCAADTDFPESHPSLPCPYRDGRPRPVRTGLSMLRANVGGAGFWEACLHLTP